MKNKNNRFIYGIVFLFFLMVCFLNPIVGDDWWNYPIGKQGLYKIISRAVELYFIWEGRFVSRVLINLLTYHKILWNFVNASVMTSIVYLINKNTNINKKHDNIFVLLSSILILTLMHPYMFFQTVTWVAGNITYMFVIPFVIYYVYLITKDKINKLEYSFLIITSIIGTMYIENIALIFVFLNCLYLLIDFIKNKKINYKIIILLVLSIITTLLMLLSPGSRDRAINYGNAYFNSLSIFGKIKFNTPDFVKNTFFTNIHMMILMVIGSILLIKNKIKNKKIKLPLYVMELLMFMGPVFYFLNGFGLITNNIFSEKKIFVVLFYGIMTIINSILLVLKNKEFYKDRICIFFCIGMLSNIVMLVSPIWAPRTSLGTYIFTSIAYILVIDKYLENKKIINYIFTFLVVCSFALYGIISISIYRQYLENRKIIEKVIEDKSDVLYLESYPDYVMNSINPTEEFHETEIKKYYGINPNVKIELIPNDWKFRIFYRSDK